MINATAYLDDNKVNSNIAFIKSDRSDVIKDENTVEAFFKSNPPHSGSYTSQYSEYMEPGEYIIVIQITQSPLHNKFKTYTYRRISVNADSDSQGNVMAFSTAKTGYYQEWTNKY